MQYRSFSTNSSETHCSVAASCRTHLHVCLAQYEMAQYEMAQCEMAQHEIITCTALCLSNMVFTCCVCEHGAAALHWDVIRLDLCVRTVEATPH